MPDGFRKGFNFYDHGFRSNCRLSGPIKIGAHVSIFDADISRYTYIAGQGLIIKAKIGPFCSIAQGVTIGLPSHPTCGISTNPIFFSNLSQCGIKWRDDATEKEFLPVIIGADVWIGANVLIKGGTKIGIGAVIGAGAVVTRDVPDFAVVGGVPAKIIRYRFDKLTCEKLLASRWWEAPVITLRENIDHWINPIVFVEKLTQNRQNSVTKH